MKLDLVSAPSTKISAQTSDEYLFYEPILAQRRKSQKVEVGHKEKSPSPVYTKETTTQQQNYANGAFKLSTPKNSGPQPKHNS